MIQWSGWYSHPRGTVSWPSPIQGLFKVNVNAAVGIIVLSSLLWQEIVEGGWFLPTQKRLKLLSLSKQKLKLLIGQSSGRKL